ncbi:23420_t:CDS:2 [Dentiscutata erythropus]|uniref:23420_t:CDS:1 n=1 Tax=Dentiscutata erythropus TaxID=1348616 RepID=A0A9N9EKQ5_9GLOM|nr:23420_t:CDS:2 [Dentiscutata erythropus]
MSKLKIAKKKVDAAKTDLQVLLANTLDGLEFSADEPSNILAKYN